MKHKILSLIILVVLSSCVKLKKKDQDQQAVTAEPTLQQVQEQQPTSIENIEKENFKLNYEYNTDDAKSLTQVIFHFPTRWPSELVVEKTNAGHDSPTKFGIEVLKQHQWSDYLTSEDKISYKFYKKVYNQLELLDEVEVLPVLNLDVREDIDLAEKYSLNNKTKIIYIKYLRISSQAHLFVQDFSGVIKVENLYSESGFLQTFRPNLRASDDKDGRSVGGFQLDILRGEGDLNLYLVAESGADGKDGNAPNEQLRGEKGEDGEPAKFGYVGVNNDMGFSRNDYQCITNPKPGHKGKRGQKGYPGFDGKNGGDVKPIEVINKDQNLRVNFFTQAGQKGNKGRGGSGGEGGVPGRSGDGAEKDFSISFLKVNPNQMPKYFIIGMNNMISKKCDPAADGEFGDRGESGPDGHDGLDGQIIKNSI